MGIDPRLLEILACPACKAPVTLSDGWLVCGGCGRRYPIREGIPVMLVDEAEPPSAPPGTAGPGSSSNQP